MRRYPRFFQLLLKVLKQKLKFGIHVGFFYLRKTALKFFFFAGLLSLMFFCEIMYIIFPAASFGDLLLNKFKTQPFVSWNNDVTEVFHLPLVVALQ